MASSPRAAEGLSDDPRGPTIQSRRDERGDATALSPTITDGPRQEDRAVRIQRTLETLYAGVGGRYHCGDAAWTCVREQTGVDLKHILEEIAAERSRGHGR